MWLGSWSFEFLLQIAECLQPAALVFADPPLIDIVNGDRIEVVELFAAAPDDCDEVGLLEDFEVLGDSLARHGEQRAKPSQRLPAALVQRIEQLASAGIGEGLEHVVHVDGEEMQPKGCMSSDGLRGAVARSRFAIAYGGGARKCAKPRPT